MKRERGFKPAQVCKARTEHARNQQLNFHKSTTGKEARAHLEGESRQDEAHNCKAMLDNPSSRPLGNKEPQPTFSKTSVARDQK